MRVSVKAATIDWMSCAELVTLRCDSDGVGTAAHLSGSRPSNLLEATALSLDSAARRQVPRNLSSPSEWC